MTLKGMEEIDKLDYQSLEELGFVQIQDDDNAYKIALKKFFWDALEMGAPELYLAVCRIHALLRSA